MFKPEFPEYSNGCTGIEWIWHKLAKRRPCFAKCCDDHDKAYVFSRTPFDKIRADLVFLLCLLRFACPWCCTCLARLKGWLYSGIKLLGASALIALYLLFACCMYAMVNILGWPFWFWAQWKKIRGK